MVKGLEERKAGSQQAPGVPPEHRLCGLHTWFPLQLSRLAHLSSASVFVFFFFYLLFMIVTERERGRDTAGFMHREPDVGVDPKSPGSRPGPKAGAKPLRHPGIP